ncbi:uncharacterized protein [Haliotis asinina]|uniref:uncharacterized protein n=1 Tax=Haliotis asinina TaxID=109174 RepID=UPI003531E6A3
MNKVIFAVAVVAGLVSCCYAACDFTVIGKCSDELGKKSGGQQDKATLCRVYGEFKSCLGSMQDCDLSDTLKTMEDSLKQASGVDLGTCSAGTMVQVSIACVLLALRLDSLPKLYKLTDTGRLDSLPKLYILINIGRLDSLPKLYKLTDIGRLDSLQWPMAFAVVGKDHDSKFFFLTGAAGGADTGAGAGNGGACDFEALVGCTDIIAKIGEVAQDMTKLCRVVSDYKGCLSAQKNCDTSAQLKSLDDIAKQANMDLNSCDSSTCDSTQAMKCSEILQKNEGASQDRGTLCSAFDQFKGCLSEQKNCDTSTFMKQMEKTMKDLGVDLSTCSAGTMVQVSIICVLMALIASFFAG